MTFELNIFERCFAEIFSELVNQEILLNYVDYSFEVTFLQIL
jgi:hypothetical protein